MGLIKLAINRQTKQLVSYDGSVTTLPPLYQTNTQEFRVQVVDPSGGLFNTTFTPVDVTGSQLRMVLSQVATGVSGDESSNLLAAAYAGAWAWDGTNKWFTGSLDLNTAEIALYIDQASSKTAILELNLVTGGTPETLLSHTSGAATNVTLCANCDAASASAPSVLTTPPSIGEKAIVDGVGGVTIADNVVTVTGLALGFTPSYWLIWVNAPSGSGAIAANFIVGSGSSGGFSFVMSAIPENDDYTVTYVPVP